jgi:hypothetical protein
MANMECSIELVMAECDMKYLWRMFNADTKELNAEVSDGIAVIRSNKKGEDWRIFLFNLSKEGIPFRGTREGHNGSYLIDFCAEGGVFSEALKTRDGSFVVKGGKGGLPDTEAIKQLEIFVKMREIADRELGWRSHW